MGKLLLLSLLFTLAGCSMFVPVIDVSTVATETMQKAYRIKVAEINSASKYPEISARLGSITAYSCRKGLTDPPPSRGDALMQLRLNAVAIGADGIKDLAYNSDSNILFCINCWDTVQVSGVAVKFQQ